MAMVSASLSQEDIMTTTSFAQSNPSTNGHAEMPPKAESSAPPEGGRGPNGRFCKGNGGGPGNPYARQVAAMRQEFIKAVTAEDMAAIARAMIDKAKEGDAAAARIVLQYTLGRPAETVDPDRGDEMEWQQWRRESQIGEWDRVCMGMHVSLANYLARFAVPAIYRKNCAEMERMMDEREERHREEAAAREREAARRAERKAQRAERQAAPDAAAQAAPRKEEAPAAPVSGGMETPTKGQAATIVVPVEAQEEDSSGQMAAVNARAEEVERALRLLGATVTKRVETTQRAGNGFVH
jgi:hypothetical protein